MNNKTDQVVYLNNCELVIQSLSFRARGTYYFIWKKGKKSIQSNKYQIANDDPVSPKDMLSLSLKVYYQGNVALQRHTHLILFNAAGEQVDRVKLMINEWTAQFRQIQIAIGGGSVKLKGKRKGVMKLEKFHRLRSEVEETSEDEAARFLKKGSNKMNNEKDQLLRLTKQVQDLNFLVDKLKEQRNSGLEKIKKLDDQLSKVSDRMGRDLSKLRDYFNMKIQMRESVYKEQIQQLVTSFNKNYELNLGIMQSLVRQKFQYQDEIRQLKESNHQYITQQSQSFEKLIAEMQRHKQIVDEELKDSNQKLHQREQTISQLNDEIDRLNQQLEQFKNAYKKLEEDKSIQDANFQDHINQLSMKITEQQNLINQANMTIEKLTSEAKFNEQQIKSYVDLITEHQKEKAQIHQQHMNLMEQKETMAHQNQLLKAQLKASKDYTEELNNQIQKIRLQFIAHSQKVQKDLEERTENFQRQINLQKEENLSLKVLNDDYAKNKIELESQVYRLDLMANQKDEQINVLRDEIEKDKRMLEQITIQMGENMEQSKRNQTQLTDKIGQFIQKNTELEQANLQLHAELKQITWKTQEQMIKMKSQYQTMGESNKNLYEDQMEMLRKNQQETEANFANVRDQYEEQIAKLMENNKLELQEQSQLYRDDIQKKQKELFDLIKEKGLLRQQLEALKFKVHLDQLNRIQNIPKNKKLRRKKDMNIQQIEQNPDEEESQQEQESLVVPKRRQKKKQQKPLVIQSVEEKSSENLEEISNEVVSSSGGQQEGESIFDMIKKKKSQGTTKKGKLRLQKRPKADHVLQQLNLSEQEGIQVSEPQLLKAESKKPKLKTEQDEISKEQQQSISQSFEQKKKPQKKLKRKVLLPPQQQQEQQQSEYVQKPIKKMKKRVLNFDDNSKGVEELLEKIAQLEQAKGQLQTNQQKIKARYQKQESKLKKKISQLQNQINDLEAQIQDLKSSADPNSQSPKDKNKAHKNQMALQDTFSQNFFKKRNQQAHQQQIKSPTFKTAAEVKQPPSPRSPKSPNSNKKQKKPSKEIASEQKKPEKNVDIEGQKEMYRRKIQTLEGMLAQKQIKIEYLQNEVNTLNKQQNKLKVQLGQRSNMLESKVLQKRNEGYQLSFAGEGALKQSIAVLQDKFSSEKQKYHQLKMRYEQKKKENEQLFEQNRKIKKFYQELQQKDRRRHVPRSIQELQNQIQESNKKVLEVSKTLNQVRLQRDSFEQEIRLIRKKLAETTKTNHQLQSRASENQREADDLRRKEQRYKREIQQWQEQSKRLKQSNKKTVQELNEVRKSQSDFFVERKKILDEVVKLEGVIANKQTEMIKLNKEIQKIRNKMNESSDVKQGRERQYRGQMQKLQIQRSKLQRKNRENEEIINQLRQKLQAADKQAKKNLQERKQTYGQKLKRYIQQIITVKEIVEQYQQQNERIKIHNSQFFQQNQLLKVSYEKLQAQYQQLLTHSQKQGSLIQENNKKISELEGAIKNYTVQEEKNKIVISSLKKEIDNQRIVSRKKSQKMQALQQMNERFLYDIKNLKLKLGQFEFNFDDKHKLEQEVSKSHQTIDSLQEKVNKISEQYNFHLEKYIYTREDVQQALRQLKQHQDKVKQNQFSRIIQQLDESSAAKRQKMETQLLALYSENQKLRVSLHKANEDYLQAQLQMAQIEKLREKNKKNQKQKSILEKRLVQVSDELKALRQECRRTEIKFNESLRNQEGKSTQNVILLQRYQEVSKKYQQLNETHTQQKIQNKRIIDKYKALIDQKDENIERLCTELQNLNNKLLSNQLQINRLKEIQTFSNQDSNKKIKKLQNKIQEINQNYRQKQREIEVTYKAQIKQLKSKNTRLEEELMQKLRRLQELNEGVIMLQREVQEVTDELTSARSQIAEDGEVYTFQINKLRNQMRQMELTYDKNMHNLEQQLSAMSKELTSLKYARQNGGNSRLRGSRQSEMGDDRSGRRYQQKMKLKQKRIQQLKQTILAYEQKIVELTRNENKRQQIEYFQSKIANLQKQYEEMSIKKSQQITRLNESNKTFRKNLQNMKNREEELILKIEQKDLELQTLKSQLLTTRKLYTDLQKEIDKRKQSLSRQIQSEFNYRVELERCQRQLLQQTQKLSSINYRIEELQTAVKKKDQQIIQNKDLINKLQRQKTSLLDQQRKKLQGESFAKLKIKEMQQQIDSTKNENRKLRNELSMNLKQINNLKTQVNQKNNTVSDLIKQLQNNDKIISSNQSLLSKYIRMNEQCLDIWGTNLDELIATAVNYKNQIEAKQDEIQKLNQEIQQLKFQLENKLIDYDVVKKQNYELNLKDQEKEQFQIELLELKQKYQRIQREKLALQFREQTIKMTLEHMINSDENKELELKEVRKKIRNLLNNNF